MTTLTETAQPRSDRAHKPSSPHYRGLTNGMTAMPQQPGNDTDDCGKHLLSRRSPDLLYRQQSESTVFNRTTGPMIDITGTLIQVGANYIILQPIETDDLMICDVLHQVHNGF